MKVLYLKKGNENSSGVLVLVGKKHLNIVAQPGKKLEITEELYKTSFARGIEPLIKAGFITENPNEAVGAAVAVSKLAPVVPPEVVKTFEALENKVVVMERIEEKAPEDAPQPEEKPAEPAPAEVATEAAPTRKGKRGK
jgi:hypothetical protein